MVLPEDFDRTASFDTQDTEDAFERMASMEVKDPKNKDMLGRSDEIGNLLPEDSKGNVPGTDHLGQLRESDEYSQGSISRSYEEGARKSAESGLGHESYSGGEFISQSYDPDSSPEAEPRRPAAYSSPYRKSVDTYGSDSVDYSPGNTVSDLNMRGSEERSRFRPEESASPTGRQYRRPYSARDSGHNQESVGYSEASRRAQVPTTASPAYQGARLKRVLQAMMQRDPRTWDITEVRYWLDFVGLSQHRYKFSHHGVDGKTLVNLSDGVLKFDIGIHAVGQRQQLLEAIQDLKSSVDMNDETPLKAPTRHSRPTSAPQVRPEADRGGALGGMTIKERHLKLEREIEKAKLRADQQHQMVEEANRRAELAVKEVEALQGQLRALWKEARQCGEDIAIDTAGAVPWLATGKHAKQGWDPVPERYGTKKVIPDRFTRPKINKHSRELMANRDESNRVWNRAKSDVLQKEAKIKERQRQLEEEAAGPNNSAVKKDKRNLIFLCNYFRDHFGLDVPRDQIQAVTIIDQTLEAYQDQICTTEEYTRLDKLKGAKKLEGLTAILKQKSFLTRYKSGLESQKTKLKELDQKYNADLAQPAHSESAWEGAMYKFYTSLGWVASEDTDAEEGGSPVSIDRLNALLKRVRILKIKEEEEAEGEELDDDPRLSQLSSDGLEQLEASSGRSGALEDAVRLLKSSHHKDLGKAMILKDPKKKKKFVYKLYRNQAYLETCAEDLRKREEKAEKAARGELYGLEETVKTAPAGQFQSFMQRLDEDNQRRQARRDESSKADGSYSEASARHVKQQNILKSSVLFNQTEKGTLARPGSTKSLKDLK